MAIEALLIQQQQAKYSENILNSFMTFDELDFTYTFTSGSGNLEVSNSDEFKLGDLNVQKVRALTTSSATFNAGTRTNTTIKESGIHNIQFQAFKTDPDANIQMRLEVFVNGTLTAERTIEVQMRSFQGFVDDNWNNYFQSFTANDGDVVSLAWYFECSEVNCITYLTGYKLERSNQNLFAPTFYTKPTYLNSQWQQRIDFDNNISLIEDVATNFGFSGTSTKNYVGNDLLEGTGNFAPKRLNDIFSVNANFLCKVPTGDNIHLDVQFIINGITYQGDTIYLFKPIGEFQYANLYFEYPVTQEFIDNGGIITLTAKGAGFEISKRKSIVKVQSNY
jgi:hypothetical protein